MSFLLLLLMHGYGCALVLLDGTLHAVLSLMKTKMNREVVMDQCERCEKNEAQEPHLCPFAWEIEGNDLDLCTCCEECEDDCAMEI